MRGVYLPVKEFNSVSNEKQTIQYGTGSVNFSSHSSQWAIAVFEPPKTRQQILKIAGVILKNKAIFPASENQDINGRIHLINAEIPDGHILMLEVAHYQRAVLYRASMAFVRVRNSGPIVKLFCKPMADTVSQLPESFPMFIGHADFLNIDEMLELGYMFTQTAENRARNIEHFNYCFSLQTLKSLHDLPAPKAEKIITRSGEEKIVIIPVAPTRRFRV